MAIKKVKLPDNSSQDIHDARIAGVDSTPTSGSENVVTSGGVASALAEKLDIDDSIWEAGTGESSARVRHVTDPQSGNVANGDFSVAEGTLTQALSDNSHAEGNLTIAYANSAHAEGVSSRAYGRGSHAEGGNTRVLSSSNSDTTPTASTDYMAERGPSFAHAEGNGSVALGAASHVEGRMTKTSATATHAEGDYTLAARKGAHAEGTGRHLYKVHVGPLYVTSENWETDGVLVKVTAEDFPKIHLGDTVVAIDPPVKKALVEGGRNGNNLSDTYVKWITDVNNAYEIKLFSPTYQGDVADCFFLDGNDGISYFDVIFSDNTKEQTKSKGLYSHTEGATTSAEANYAHAEGHETQALGEASHSQGESTLAVGNFSNAEGLGSMVESSFTVFGESANTTEYTTSVNHNLVPGQLVFLYDVLATVQVGSTGTTLILDKSFGYMLHRDDEQTIKIVYGIATGTASHTEGGSNIAAGNYGHAEGLSTLASGTGSHAEGIGTQTFNLAEHAEGYYNLSNHASNVSPNAGNTRHSIGIGTSENDRKNAVEVMQNGDVYIKGLGGYAGNNISTADSLQSVISNLSASSLLNGGDPYTSRDAACTDAALAEWAGNPLKTVFGYWFVSTASGAEKGSGLFRQSIVKVGTHYKCIQYHYYANATFKRTIAISGYSTTTKKFATVGEVGEWTQVTTISSVDDLAITKTSAAALSGLSTSKLKTTAVRGVAGTETIGSASSWSAGSLPSMTLDVVGENLTISFSQGSLPSLTVSSKTLATANDYTTTVATGGLLANDPLGSTIVTGANGTVSVATYDSIGITTAE